VSRYQVMAIKLQKVIVILHEWDKCSMNLISDDNPHLLTA